MAVAVEVHEVHELLGIESGPEHAEARPWKEAASDSWGAAREAGAQGVENVKDFGGKTADTAKALKGKLGARFAGRKRFRRDG